MKRIWFTWETQRRNGVLAAAFGCTLCQFDDSWLPAPIRYCLSSARTIAALVTRRPDVVIAQCPSIFLAGLLVLLRPVFRFQLLIDAHNIAVERAAADSSVGRFVRWTFRAADFVIVSNSGLRPALEACGIKTLILPDALPPIPAPADLRHDPLPRVLLVCTFAADEPIAQFIEGSLMVSEIPFKLFITGNKEKAPELLKYENEKFVFTGFLPHHEYDRLLYEVDLVADLTTRENCLVCGSYEAISAGKPLLLSDHAVNREMFPKGVLFSKNSAEDYAAALRQFFSGRRTLEQEIRAMKTDFLARWKNFRREVEVQLRK